MIVALPGLSIDYCLSDKHYDNPHLVVSVMKIVTMYCNKEQNIGKSARICY